jgi:murein DD-endopeptidase MepM/ murein hydrolase activator NlpD
LPVTQYKKVEKEFADRMGSWFRRVWVSVASFFKRMMIKGKQRFTVMLIPHSEKKIFNFQISFFTLIFVTFTIGIVLIGFFFLATSFTYTNKQNVSLTQDRDRFETDLTSLKDEIARIRTVEKQFKTSIDTVMTGIRSQDVASATGTNIISASFPATDEPLTNNRELSELQSLANLLDNSKSSLDEVGKILSTYKSLLAETPTLWPLRGGVGNITTLFEWTINPFTKVGYMHTGVDIAWGQGTPVLATADGTVIQTGWTEDFGNNVTIQHKYGFYTRYAHLSAFAGKHKGDHVSQGDIIGYVGTTGLSTGPHLHYEVRLGSSYLDPMGFLSMSSDTAITTAGGRSAD